MATRNSSSSLDHSVGATNCAFGGGQSSQCASVGQAGQLGLGSGSWKVVVLVAVVHRLHKLAWSGL